MNDYEGLILCCLMVSDDCFGLTLKENLHVDESGDRWNYCEPCYKHEQYLILKEGQRE